MSILVTLTILFLFPGSAVSEIGYPNCTSDPTGQFTWMYNSLGQNPCAVAAYLESTCWQGSFNIEALPSGYHYIGPDSETAGPCMCSTVTYSLISACDLCQGSQWIRWSEWTINCGTNTQPPSTFPNAVPNGTVVPRWALLDVTLEDNWNPDNSMSAGDSPEIGPSTVIGASSTLPASPSASNRPSSSQPSGAVPLLIVTSTSFPDIPYEYPPTSSPSISSTSNTGAIVGGVIGGIALVGIIIVCIVYTRRRRNGSPPYAASSACAVPPAPFVVDVSPQSPIEHEGKKALSDDGTLVSSIMPDSPVSPTRVYNSNIASTLPEPQDDPYSPKIPNKAIFGQHQGSGNDLPLQASRPQYHGLPNV